MPRYMYIILVYNEDDLIARWWSGLRLICKQGTQHVSVLIKEREKITLNNVCLFKTPYTRMIIRILSRYQLQNCYDKTHLKVDAKVRKIRNRYNQAPHLSLETTWEGDKTQ